MNHHFKKTAIALAVLSLGTALSTASATTTDQSQTDQKPPLVLSGTNKGPFIYTVTESTTVSAANHANVTISGNAGEKGVLTFIIPIDETRTDYTKKA